MIILDPQLGTLPLVWSVRVQKPVVFSRFDEVALEKFDCEIRARMTALNVLEKALHSFWAPDSQ